MGEVPAQNHFDRDDWWDVNSFPYGLAELLNPVRLPFIYRLLADRTAPRVLDVGCGGGYIAVDLAAAGSNVVGVDVSVAAIAAASSRQSGPLLRYEVADAHHLPFTDEAFDVAILSEVLEHLAAPQQAFREASRVLSSGGILIVTGPNRTALSWLTLIWLAQRSPLAVLPSDLHDYRSFVRPSELRSWAADFEMEQCAFTGVGIRLRDIPAALRVIQALRRQAIDYPRAARSISLRRSPFAAIAYMTAFTKR